jgi:F0F1-type ATP synthase assembly protein I
MSPSPGNTPNSQNSAGNGGAGGKGALRSLGLAMSLPFTLIVCVGIGGGAGYFLDKWMHSSPAFVLILGVLGFAAGFWDILRQLSKDEKREQGNGG